MKRLLLSGLLGCMIIGNLQAGQLLTITKDYLEQTSYTFASDNIKCLNVAKGAISSYLALSTLSCVTATLQQSNAVANITDEITKQNIFDNGSADENIPSFTERWNLHSKAFSCLTFWGLLCTMIFKPEWVGCAHLPSNEIFFLPSVLKPHGHWAYGALMVSVVGMIGNNNSAH